jgi:hypothetical protein
MTDQREDTTPPDGTTESAALPRRRSRFWLYAPYVGLLALAVAWSIGWVLIRARAVSEIDGFFTREAAAGRTWDCPGRTVGGYPFRIEMRCDALTFARSDLTFGVGPVVAVAQVYQPGHVIVEAKGPLRLKEGGTTLDADWRLLEASFHAALSGFQRLSLVVEAPKGTVEGVVLGQTTPGAPAPEAPAPGGTAPATPPPGTSPVPIAFSAEHFEAHARPTPGRFESDGAIDLSARLQKAALPVLDPLLGGPEPADMALDATVNRARGFGPGPLPGELERWRHAGGSLDVTLLSLAKGPRRVQARGTLALDEAHRLSGEAGLRAAGVEQIVGAIMGERLGAERGALIGNLVGQLLGGLARPRNGAAPAAPPATGDEAGLKPLPPLRLADGRVFFGPLAIPNVRLVPLY